MKTPKKQGAPQAPTTIKRTPGRQKKRDFLRNVARKLP
jgi:hypothetical protein